MTIKYLSVCAIFKDEASYLKEWVDFHLSNGVDHFFLYDNLSSDGFHEVLAPYVAEGYVTLTTWPTKKSDNGQRAAYQHCLEERGGLSTWIAFIDIDEFLFGVTSWLPEVLREYERHASVFVHWQNFGSSMQQTREPGDVISRFTRRAPTQWSRNIEGKSIVQPSKVAAWGSPHAHRRFPHHFDMAFGEHVVTERREVLGRTKGFKDQIASFAKHLLGRHAVRVGSLLPLFFNPYGSRKGRPAEVSVSRLRINHYVVKSREEFALKVKRMSDKPQKYNDYFFRFHDRNEVEDRLLADRALATQSQTTSLRTTRGAPGR